MKGTKLALKLFLALLMATVAVGFSLFLPGLALAQEAEAAADTFLGLSYAQLALYLGIALAAIELAKRVAAAVPGKKDDEIVGIVEGVLRKVVDFVAGKTGKASDPSLVKRE